MNRILNAIRRMLHRKQVTDSTEPQSTVPEQPTVPEQQQTANEQQQATINQLMSQLQALTARIEQLESRLRNQEAAAPETSSPAPVKSSSRKSSPRQEPAAEPVGSHQAPSPQGGGREGAFRSSTILFNEQFLRARYDLRYNTMKGITEYREKGDAPSPSWQPLDDRTLNTMTVEQLKAGGQSWTYGMKLLVESNAVPQYNPVKEYLDSCPQWDGHDHIADLARRVPTQWAQWPLMLRRWLMAMVAQARGMNTMHGNALVPLLIGAQGTGKTTFCRQLLPPELREYFMDDIKMDNAEQVERVLGRMWLVCIDEYNAKTVREQAKIKRLLTEKDVQVRRMRSDQYRLTHRLCSFIATTNEQQPLTDPTGSRRYLCVEVTGRIDNGAPICHRQLFAQVLHLLAEGQPWHLSPAEEEALTEHNRAYQALDAAAMLLGELFRPAPAAHEHLLTMTQLTQAISAAVGDSALCPNLKQLAAALRALGFRRGACNGKHGWYVMSRSEQ